MPYKGETFIVQCDTGGFTANPNTDILRPTSIIGGKNINYHQGGKRKRKGTTKVNGTAVSGAPQITGGIDYNLINGNQFQVFATNDGKIYKNSTTTVKTGLTANKVSNFCIFNNLVYHTNTQETIQTWDGAAAGTSAIANPAADWGAGNQPSQLLVHGRGNSERLVAIGDITQPEAVYLSANGSDNFVTNVVKISIKESTGHGGIVGGVDFGDTLFLFSRRQAYLLNDTSLTTADWGYETAQWTGGVIHHRGICKTPNDVFCMSEDMDIYSITAVQMKGDYRAASVARPAFIDQWIRDNCKVSQVSKFHLIYDSIRRAVLVFLVSNNSTSNTVDICLPFYIDRPVEEAWGVPLDNFSYANGYQASCAFPVRKLAGNYVIYTGDYSGFIWELELGTTDNGNAFYNGLILPYNSASNVRISKRWDNLWLVVIPYTDTTLSVRVWIDGHLVVGEDNLITEANELLLTEDSFQIVTESEMLWNLTFSTNVDLVEDATEIGKFGKRIKVEIYNETTTSDYLLSQVLFDFVPLGALPKQ